MISRLPLVSKMYFPRGNGISCVKFHGRKGISVSKKSLSSFRDPTSNKINTFSLNRVLSIDNINKFLKLKSVVPVACKFHTSSRRYFDPALWPILRNILKGTGIISGRGFRKWWQSLPDKKRHYFIQSARKRRQEVAIFIGILCVCWYIYYWTHLQEAPVTKRERFIAFTDYQFDKIMEFNAEKLCSSMKSLLLPDTHIYYNVVINTLSHLINANQDIKEFEKIQWKVAVVDKPAVNAFVLPTGHVFVNRGLLEFVTDQDQLAFVLAHEMAHALLKHAAENLSRSQLVDYFVISAMTFLWAFMPTDGIAIVTHWFFNKILNVMLHLPYSRFLEDEADRVGLEIAAKACYDIRSGTVFWHLMDLSEKVESRSVPEWLSTHPSSHKRAELFDCLLNKYLHVRHECNCPPLPKEDPRHQLHAIRTSVDNLLTSRKARANIERFKIPMKNHNEQYIAMSALDNFKKRETDIKITMLPSALKLQDLENEEKGKKSKNKEVVKKDVEQQ